jgi:hypothetical protein
VNGEQKAVRFSWYVTAAELNNEINISIAENHLYNEEVLGRDYVGVQVYQLESQSDIEVQQCDLREAIGRKYVAVDLSITRDGGIAQARLIQEDSNASTEECLDEIIRYLESAYGFIPAHALGKPVDAVYVGYFCFGDKCTGYVN